MRGRNSNVMPFRSPDSSGGGGWAIKLFAMALYLFLGLMLAMPFINGIGVLFFLGFLYWMFVYRRLHRGSYFGRNKILLIIIGVLLLLVFPQESVSILALCALYWALIARNGKEPPYFLRFHMLNGIVFYLFLTMGVDILNAMIRFAFSLLMFIQPGEAEVMLGAYMAGFAICTLYLYLGTGVYFAITALMGRTPYLKYVTDNVRTWA